jgi:hypothetical protein
MAIKDCGYYKGMWERGKEIRVEDTFLLINQGNCLKRCPPPNL